MTKTDIRNRADLALLISTFYGKVREHPDLGPFFNQTIKNWDEHILTLTDFWETNLFFAPVYKGNPVKAHLDVDAKFDHTVEQAHFGNWIQLWFNTIDSLFEGEKASLAKERARNMSHMMYIRIFQARRSPRS